jgi:hypothetical protein
VRRVKSMLLLAGRLSVVPAHDADVHALHGLDPVRAPHGGRGRLVRLLREVPDRPQEGKLVAEDRAPSGTSPSLLESCETLSASRTMDEPGCRVAYDRILAVFRWARPRRTSSRSQRAGPRESTRASSTRWCDDLNHPYTCIHAQRPSQAPTTQHLSPHLPHRSVSWRMCWRRLCPSACVHGRAARAAPHSQVRYTLWMLVMRLL